MLRLLLVLASLYSSVSWSSEDRAHDFVEETLGQGRLILEQKEEGERSRGLCALLNGRLGVETLATNWLGEYAFLPREKGVVPEFKKMIPAMIMSKLVTVLSDGVHGGYNIDPLSVEHENKMFEVGVEFFSETGETYRGSAFVQDLGESQGMRLVDITYLGISAAQYLGRDYKRIMDQEYAIDRENSLPIEALMKHIRSQTGYRDCP